MPSVSSSSPTDLLRRGYQRAAKGGPLRVSAVAVAGLAESGVVLDGSGRPCIPSSRGSTAAALADRLDFAAQQRLRARVRAAHGAAVGQSGQRRQAAVVRRRRHRVHTRTPVGGACPSTSCTALVANWCTNRRWASRTGLLDQGTGTPWADGAAELGLPPTLLPARQPFGESVGRLAHNGLPDGLQGAALLVGGHDHPVAAIGVGAIGPGELLNSTGTADVVARSLPTAHREQRESLVGQGIRSARMCCPDECPRRRSRWPVLRRALGLLGVTTAGQRDRLDRAALDVGTLPAGLEFRCRTDRRRRRPALRDDATPRPSGPRPPATPRARPAACSTRSSPSSGRTARVASGGWTRMASVRTAKSAGSAT